VGDGKQQGFETPYTITFNIDSFEEPVRTNFSAETALLTQRHRHIHAEYNM